MCLCRIQRFIGIRWRKSKLGCAESLRGGLPVGGYARTAVCLLEGASDRFDFLLAGLGIPSSALQSMDAQTVAVPCSRDTLPAIQEQAPVQAL